MRLLLLFSAAGFDTVNVKDIEQYPFYGIPAVIAINMILACASGGTVAILIAAWAQVSHVNLGDEDSFV